VDSIHSDQGPHLIRLAVAPYAATAPRAAQPAALAETLFTNLVNYRGRPVMARGWRGLEGGETLIPCWAQPLERSRWTLRLHEIGGSRGVARVVMEPGWSAQVVDFFGRPLAPPLRAGKLIYRPQQIIGLQFFR
jgi:alpha-mannosidase